MLCQNTILLKQKSTKCIPIIINTFSYHCQRLYQNVLLPKHPTAKISVVQLSRAKMSFTKMSCFLETRHTRCHRSSNGGECRDRPRNRTSCHTLGMPPWGSRANQRFLRLAGLLKENIFKQCQGTQNDSELLF